MSGEAYVMSTKHKEALRRNHVHLVNCLMVDEMLDHLLQAGLLTRRMKMEIEVSRN